MSILSSALTHSDAAPLTGSIAATTDSGALTLGINTVWALVATGDCHIRVGPSTVGASSTSYFYLPSKVIYTIAMNRNNDTLRLYNPGGSSINYYIVRLETGR